MSEGWEVISDGGACLSVGESAFAYVFDLTPPLLRGTSSSNPSESGETGTFVKSFRMGYPLLDFLFS